MTFPSRIDMDRVQAVDSMLDFFPAVAGDNTVYRQDGKPLARCGSTDTARLVIRRLGNPIDVPLSLHLGLQSKWVSLQSARFFDPSCDASGSKQSCTLPPNLNIAISNTSLVQSSRLTGTTVWEGLLGPSTTTSESEDIRLWVELSFKGRAGEDLTLRRATEIEIRTCP